MNDLLEFLKTAPLLLCLCIFASAFIEALVLVGMLVPGFIMMMALTTAAGLTGLPFFWVVMSAISGAFLADSLSYFIGRHYSQRIQQLRIFHHRQRFFLRMQQRFEQRGLLFIIIARFFGPFRALLPFSAGTLRLHPRLFLPLAFFASIAWAPFYTLPGFTLGQNGDTLTSSEFYATFFQREFLYFMSVLFIISLIYWLSFRLVNRLASVLANRPIKRYSRPILFGLVSIGLLLILNQSGNQQVNTQIGLWLKTLPWAQLDLSLYYQVLLIVLAASVIWLMLIQAWLGATILLLLSLIFALIPSSLIKVFVMQTWLLTLVSSTMLHARFGYRFSLITLAAVVLFLMSLLMVIQSLLNFFEAICILLMSLSVNNFHQTLKLSMGRHIKSLRFRYQPHPKATHLIALTWLFAGFYAVFT